MHCVLCFCHRRRRSSGASLGGAAAPAAHSRCTTRQRLRARAWQAAWPSQQRLTPRMHTSSSVWPRCGASPATIVYPWMLRCRRQACECEAVQAPCGRTDPTLMHMVFCLGKSAALSINTASTWQASLDSANHTMGCLHLVRLHIVMQSPLSGDLLTKGCKSDNQDTVHARARAQIATYPPAAQSRELTDICKNDTFELLRCSKRSACVTSSMKVLEMITCSYL